MTGLMFYRPEDHVEYLQECLRKIKSDGVQKVRWNLFIESRRKTPLPPITPSGEDKNYGRDKSFITGKKGRRYSMDIEDMKTYIQSREWSTKFFCAMSLFLYGLCVFGDVLM